jgi:hypothetical protein
VRIKTPIWGTATSAPFEEMQARPICCCHFSLDEKHSSAYATRRYCSHPNANACPWTLPTAARSGRGNIVATLAVQDASDVSTTPRKLDDLDVRGRISQTCTRLRALWASRPVVARVHSSASQEISGVSGYRSPSDR